HGGVTGRGDGRPAAAAVDHAAAPTDDFTSVGPLGFTLTKAERIDRHRTGSLRFTSFGLEDERRVSVYRDVAVIVGLLIGKGTYQGRPLPAATRASLILLR